MYIIYILYIIYFILYILFTLYIYYLHYIIYYIYIIYRLYILFTLYIYTIYFLYIIYIIYHIYYIYILYIYCWVSITSTTIPLRNWNALMQIACISSGWRSSRLPMGCLQAVWTLACMWVSTMNTADILKLYKNMWKLWTI